MTTLERFNNGEWVDSNELQEALHIDFCECFRRFDFKREAEWWSIAGKTEEERQRNGQKVQCFFRMKEVI